MITGSMAKNIKILLFLLIMTISLQLIIKLPFNNLPKNCQCKSIKVLCLKAIF